MRTVEGSGSMHTIKVYIILVWYEYGLSDGHKC